MITYSAPQRVKSRGRLVANFFTRIRDNGKGTWRTLGTDDYVEACAELRRMIDETSGARLAGDRSQCMISRTEAGHALEPVLLEWGEYKRRSGCSRHTLRSQHYRIKQWCEFLGPRTPVELITHRDLERLLDHLADNGAGSPKTLNNYLQWLRTFFAWAQNRGYCTKNPAAPLPRRIESHRRILTLDADQQERFLVAAERRGAGLWAATLLLAGLRRGTVESLTWSDVDLLAGCWQIPAEKMKSRRDYQAPLAPGLLARLRAAGSHEPGERIAKAPTQAVWKALVKEIGVERLRPHDLRRTFVTTLRRGGVGLDVAMSLSDHKDIRTVLECYRAVDAQEQLAALRQAYGG